MPVIHFNNKELNYIKVGLNNLRKSIPEASDLLEDNHRWNLYQLVKKLNKYLEKA